MEFKKGFEQTYERKVCSLDFNQPNGFHLCKAETLNDQQKNAIVASFNAVQQPYSKNKTVMIQGPPGTGKTHTLVGIVKNLFINCSQTKLKPLRILICAPSNGAIDEIALRLIRDCHFLEELRIVRIVESRAVVVASAVFLFLQANAHKFTPMRSLFYWRTWRSRAINWAKVDRGRSCEMNSYYSMPT